MIVSFETAKVAKEKGFNKLCLFHYSDTKLVSPFLENGSSTDTEFRVELEDLLDNYNLYFNKYSAPTQDELQKWLRDVRKINVYCIPDDVYYWECFVDGERIDLASTYENVLEEGLKQALTLIK